VGYSLRSRGWSEPDAGWSMEGRTALVTGASTGLGLATSEALARLGASVVMVSRDPERGERARAQVAAQSGRPDVRFEAADLSSLASVRSLAKSVLERVGRLDVLVNNAGVLLPERRLSVDGLEMAFATNVLGPFLLTNLLLPLLRESAPARVVNVSSGGMYTERIRADDLQFERQPYDGPAAYARTKRAQVILTEVWADMLTGSRVVVNAMHPGWADTPGVRDSLPKFYRVTRPFLRTAAQGADTIVWLAAAPEAEGVTGRFWMDRRPRPTHRLPRTRETPDERRALWDECLRLSGMTPGEVAAIAHP
jgi:NAD(P)-dependent dehydrogenase (short-subunit alcohol dehydrogenase family)